MNYTNIGYTENTLHEDSNGREYGTRGRQA